MTYENSGSIEGSYDASNFELKDKEDHRYKREYGGREPLLDTGILPPNQKVKGFITYEIPEVAESIEVIYSNIAGQTIVFTSNL